ncbi:hypothetical protein, partial [Pseudomonas aeruginosa]|uniref:hypothetical protein n=1 Tax=Pseudomonas aeruginosa TaxID=287 RepID=UPI0039696A98
MHSLASYIRAIHALPSPVSISDAQVEEQQRCEDGVEIHSCEALYRFDNGVRLRQHCERDLLPSSGACEECWIGYVLEPGLAWRLPLPFESAIP